MMLSVINLIVIKAVSKPVIKRSITPFSILVLLGDYQEEDETHGGDNINKEEIIKATVSDRRMLIHVVALPNTSK